MDFRRRELRFSGHSAGLAGSVGATPFGSGWPGPANSVPRPNSAFVQATQAVGRGGESVRPSGRRVVSSLTAGVADSLSFGLRHLERECHAGRLVGFFLFLRSA